MTDQSLLDQYSWLTIRLIKAFGIGNVRPELMDSGNTLLYSFGPPNTPGYILAEKRAHKSAVDGEYELLQEEIGWSVPRWDPQEYSLNAESDRVQAIEEMIQLSVEKINEIARSRNGIVTNQGGK